MFTERRPESRSAYRSGNSSGHDSSAWLAWALPRGREKPEGEWAAGLLETNLREDCLTMATLVCNTDRAIVAENNMVEDSDADEVASPAEPGIPEGHELAGVWPSVRPMAPWTAALNTTAPQSRAWSLAPLSSGGRAASGPRTRGSGEPG